MPHAPRRIRRLDPRINAGPVGFPVPFKNLFYGWVYEDYRFRETVAPVFVIEEHISTGGYHWGAVASLGGTIKISKISLEPFVNGGFQKMSLDGSGGFRTPGLGLSMDKLKDEWSVGGGFSIRY